MRAVFPLCHRMRAEPVSVWTVSVAGWGTRTPRRAGCRQWGHTERSSGRNNGRPLWFLPPTATTKIQVHVYMCRRYQDRENPYLGISSQKIILQTRYFSSAVMKYRRYFLKFRRWDVSNIVEPFHCNLRHVPPVPPPPRPPPPVPAPIYM